MGGRRQFSTIVAWMVTAAVIAAAPQTFRSAVAMVHLPVIVLDRDGNPVRGLTASDFEVVDEGAPQKIVSFSEGPPGPSVPLHLGLMLDKSGSMDQDIKDASDAAVRFVDEVSEAKDVTFVEFETGVRIARFEPPSYHRLFERIRGKSEGRFTALYDAIGHYTEGTRQRAGQHILLMYTDGGDSGLGMTMVQARDLLRLGNVIVYAVGYLAHQTGTERIRQQAVLSQLSRETGGEAFFPARRQDTMKYYQQIRAEVEARYTLGYASPANPVPDRFRRVAVRVTRPDLQDVRVRTRSGYTAPSH